MKFPAISLLFVLSAAVNTCYAQNSVLAGKIVDEDNKPVPGAVIKLSSKDLSAIEVKSDSDGLYCSKLLACGHYHMAVFIDGKCRGLKKMSLDDISGSKRFFLIRVLGGKIELDRVESDPAMAVKLARINSRHDFDGGNGRMGSFRLKNERVQYIYTKKDSTIKNEKPVNAPGEKVPQN